MGKKYNRGVNARLGFFNILVYTNKILTVFRSMVMFYTELATRVSVREDSSPFVFDYGEFE